MDAVKSNTVTRICKKMDYKKNVMPKGILRYENSKTKHMVPDNELLDLYQYYMGMWLYFCKVRSELQAIERGYYLYIITQIQKWFAEDKKYGVRRYNRITIDMSEIEDFFPEDKKVEELQKKLLRIIIESIIKSVSSRCTETKEYKTKLKPEEKFLMVYYLTELLRLTGLIKDYAGKTVELLNILGEKYPELTGFIEEIKKTEKQKS